MTFERPLQLIAGATDRRPVQTRHHTPSDLRALKDIARVSYHDTRFYYDTHFSRERVDQLYEAWIENSCNGFAEEVLVAEDKRHPIGFITCHVKGDGRGQIGLVGVAPAARGAGVGRALVEDAVRWFTERGSTAVSVVTQARNLGAMRLYERCGFKVQQSHLWYHRWFR
jgi:dTDP-4-amino-4,6-dideoxy-D-galactose acyltransferase